MSVVDMVDICGHAEVQQNLSGVQLLLCIEVWQSLMACVDVHLNTY